MNCKYCLNIPDAELVNPGVPGLDFCSHCTVEMGPLLRDCEQSLPDRKMRTKCSTVGNVTCLSGKAGR